MKKELQLSIVNSNIPKNFKTSGIQFHAETIPIGMSKGRAFGKTVFVSKKVPAVWKEAIITLSGWRLEHPGGDQNVKQIGIDVGIRKGKKKGTIDIIVHSILRDNDAKEIRSGEVKVVIFFTV